MSSKKLQGSILVFLFFSVLLSAFIYRTSISSYFFQDDWFSLSISKVGNIADFFRLFIPRSDVIYYRPLGMQVPFFLLRTFFGINPTPFHVITMVTHMVNIFLVFFLIRLLKRDDGIAFLCAFMYGVSTVHYIPAFWFATYAFVLGPAFFLSSFALFVMFWQKQKTKYYVLSIILFILGLFTNEIVMLLPIVLLFYQFYASKIEIKKLSPYFTGAVLLIVARFMVFPPPINGAYQLGLGKELASNLRAYLLWSFNWPEEMKAQFTNLLMVNPVFIKEFFGYFAAFIVTFAIDITLFYVLPLIFIVRKKSKELFKLAVFCGAWFIIGLLPVLFFTGHSFAYYLPISLVGLLFLSNSLFKYFLEMLDKHNRYMSLFVITILIVSWIISSVFTIDFNSKIHWAPRRAQLSELLVEQIKNDPTVLQNKVAFVNNTSENKLALNNQDALKVIFNDGKIRTVYGYPTQK